MKRSCLFILLISVMTLSVFGQKKRDLNVPVTMNYMLPKISFQVEVTMECSELVPGPFSGYAEQQLGIRPEITSKGEEWKISNIRFIPVPVLDEKNSYKVTVTGDYSGILLQLTPEGFLSGVGMSSGNVQEKEITYTPSPQSKAAIEYARFGIQSTLKEELDSNFTMLEVEGEMRRVWDPIERYVLKENEDYIQEVTDELFGIREKRLSLLAGENGGQATEAALKALNELEEHYLSLFLGKKVARKVVETITYIPEKANESVTLFRFSENVGITTKNNVSAQPYIVEIKNLFLPKDENANQTRSGNGIVYCVPAVADLILTRGNEKLIEERCIVPQLGYTKLLPLEVIGNEGISVEFYPQYGSVKSIVKNR